MSHFQVYKYAIMNVELVLTDYNPYLETKKRQTKPFKTQKLNINL